MRFTVAPGGSLRGELRIPGDKSISHRAVMLGAIAEGETQISGFLEGEDALATQNAFEAMGVQIEREGPGQLRVQGVGLHGLKPAGRPLDLGNSGTSMRLMAGLLAGQRFESTLIGDASLSRRPMTRVTQPLSQMGAHIEATEAGTAPLRVHPSALKAIDYTLPMASAQVKSCVLLAGLYAEGTSSVTEPAVTRDHTERMLEGMGYAIERRGRQVSLKGGQSLEGGAIEVPRDLSSAAFFLVGASILPGSELVLPGIGVNPSRTGVLDILQMMGAKIALRNLRTVNQEPVADLEVSHSELVGIEVPELLIPLAIDELPVLFIAAAYAKGVTRFTGAGELRVKESDRIGVMARALTTLGIRVEEQPDGLTIWGGTMQGGTIAAEHDHRIAMAMAMAALRSEAAIDVEGVEVVETSFPGFSAMLQAAGARIEMG